MIHKHTREFLPDCPDCQRELADGRKGYKYHTAAVQLYEFDGLGSIVNIVCRDEAVLRKLKTIFESKHLKVGEIGSEEFGKPTLTVMGRGRMKGARG